MLSANTIWYLLLFAVSAIVLVMAIAPDAQPKRAFAFFMIVFGVTLAVEQVLLFILNAYTYSPMILTNAEYSHDDSAIGNLFSQFSVAASLTMAVVRKLRRVWYFIIAALYGLIEEGFLALGIYSHNWYQTWITVALLPVAFFFIEFLYRKTLKGLILPWYLLLMMLALFFPLIVTNWPIMVLRVMDMNPNLIGNAMTSRYLVAITHLALIMLAAVVVTLTRWRLRWKALAVAVYAVLYCVFLWLDLIRMPIWFLPVGIMGQLALACFFAWGIGRMLGNPVQMAHPNKREN